MPSQATDSFGKFGPIPTEGKTPSQDGAPPKHGNLDGESSSREPEPAVKGQSRSFGLPPKEKVSREPETNVGQSRNLGLSETEKVSREPETNVGQSHSTGTPQEKEKTSNGEF